MLRSATTYSRLSDVTVEHVVDPTLIVHFMSGLQIRSAIYDIDI